MKVRSIAALTVTAALAFSLAACGSDSGSTDADGNTTIAWWTWDDKQAASYQKCVPGFEAAHPGVKVKVSQYGWNDYWTKLTAGFVSGEAPDTFMDHVNNYPGYADQNQLLALDDFIAKDKFDMTKFSTGVDTWKYTDGKQYGLPKDWASVAFYYNADMVAEAGLTADQLDTMTWNPKDGGTFEKVVAHLTLDANGKRGDEAGFDKDNVAVYGISNVGSQGLNGQDTWSGFVSTTGWTLGDKPNWPTRFQYDAPEFKDSMNYMRSLVTKGYAPKEGSFTMGPQEQLGSKKSAMVSTGSWYATSFFALPGIKVALAPSVLGDNGKRSSITNSNADSIWAGTKHPEQAWQWVSYLGSVECQSLAGADGTFFPSIPAAMDVTKKSMMDQGIDLTVFTDQQDNGTLFTTPMFKHGAELDSTLTPQIEAFFTFQRDDDVFNEIATKSQEILAKP